ncbi:MAG: Hint domain-containing protein [Rhodobacter sp.]|nr:Hint domain-containing protein [Rhodobacter sp.]
MGYNISDVSGNATGGADQWTFTADLSDPGVTTVSGDFNVVSIFTGNDLGEATSGYSFSALSTTAYGTLTTNTTTGAFVFTIDRAAVIASGSDQAVSFTITGTSGGSSDDDTVFIQLLICVLRGTLIETPGGPVPVEALAPGDLVLTKDRGPQPVKWVGLRHVNSEELSRDPSLRPVRIQAGSLGGDLPYRDLSVSPQHRILVTDWRAELMFGEHEVLVPAKSMVNDTAIRVDHTCQPIEYYHILFDRHEIVFTEGAPTESFHPGSFAMRELGDAARVELHKLFPELFRDGYGETARLSLRPWEGSVVLPPETGERQRLAS